MLLRGVCRNSWGNVEGYAGLSGNVELWVSKQVVSPSEVPLVGTTILGLNKCDTNLA